MSSAGVLVFEKYSHGQRSLQLHSERAAHATLLETMGAQNVTKFASLPGLVLEDIPGFGFWGRESVRPEGGGVLIVNVLRFRTDAMRERYIELA